MTRKEYLINLIKNRSDLPTEEAKKIFDNIDSIWDEKTETFIKIFEKSNERRRRIDNWEAEKVLEEENKIIEKRTNNKIQNLHEIELIEKRNEEKELERLLEEINALND